MSIERFTSLGEFIQIVSSDMLSLEKLMVSHDLLCSTVTNQIAFDQRDSN